MVWFGLTQYQGMAGPKSRRGRENQRRIVRNRKRPERIPASAPTQESEPSYSFYPNVHL